ncbi:hypothetical protein D9611_007040 [Ephemerocybe angulata]|uniref:Uncharacterized protein n=1 Tax=Ephemerocybe angulata TaxID=980116 RepID=A0A8H5B1N4_9AGAR|nr:hypothetical protein D9611_007040 [Tulosesus angulatus]
MDVTKVDGQGRGVGVDSVRRGNGEGEGRVEKGRSGLGIFTPDPTPSPPEEGSSKSDVLKTESRKQKRDEVVVEGRRREVSPYRQAIQVPVEDKRFHLPKQKSAEVLRGQAGVRVASETKSPVGESQRERANSASASGVGSGFSPGARARRASPLWDGVREGDSRETGLLTPPESRSSVDSEEGVTDVSAGASNTLSPRENEIGVLGGQKRESVGKKRESVMTQSESFDFVGAYMYTRDSAGVTGVLSEKGEGPGMGDRLLRNVRPRKESLRVAAQPIAPQARRSGAVGGSLGTKATASQAPSAYSYSGGPAKGPSGAQGTGTAVNGGMNARDTQDYAYGLRRYRAGSDVSFREEESVWSASSGGGSGRAMSLGMDSEGVVGGRREGCAMVGVPPRVESSVWEEAALGEKEAPKYHYRRSVRGPEGLGVELAVKKKRSGRFFGEFVGRMFGGVS